MKKVYTFIIAICLPILMLAQDEEKKFTIDFSGFIRNDVVFNTRQVVSARAEGQFFLAPSPIVLDANDVDINANPNFNIIGINSRFRVKMTGPKTFGAKTSGMIEGDFFGTSGTTKFNFRLRHAFVNLDWGTSKLLVGQYWHPSFVTGCFPGTVSFGAGVPFNPLSRVGQLRYTYNFSEKFSAFAAVLGRGHFGGPSTTAAYQNAGIPEVSAQIQYKTDKFLIGAGVDYQLLKPSLTTTGIDTGGAPITLISDATISSVSFVGFMKLTTKPITFKLYGMYGQNNDNLVMMGGYATVYDTTYTLEQMQEGYVEYTPYNNLSAWVDIHTNGKKTQFGLFAGYSQNLGAAKEVDYSTYTGRWGNVNSMMRVAPRVVFISGKSKLGFEIEYSMIDYAAQKMLTDGVTADPDADVGGIDMLGKVTNFETADNLKVLLSYTFSF
jgi:hypothetical protein